MWVIVKGVLSVKAALCLGVCLGSGVIESGLIRQVMVCLVYCREYIVKDGMIGFQVDGWGMASEGAGVCEEDLG